MEMNDILSGLNSCDDNCCDNNNCCCGGMGSNPGLAGGSPYGLGGLNGLGGFGGCGGFGNCGLGSWIWILLILFYCGGCGYGNNYGNNNNGCCMNNCCCDCCDCCDDCCCNNCCCNNSYGKNNRNCGGLLGNCSCYLFLLVVLFLCNGNFGNLGFLGNGYGGSACGGCGGFGGPGYGFGGSSPIANGLNCCESNCSC